MKLLPAVVWTLARRGGRGRLLLAAGLTALIALVAAWLGVELYAEHQYEAAREALGRYDFVAADQHMQTCVGLRPNRFRYRFLAAQAARRAARYAEAAEHLAHCEALAGDADNVVLLEKMLLRAQQGRLAGVERPLWALVEADHADRAAILEALGRGYLQCYRLPLADKCFQRLVAEEPAHAEAWLWRAGIFELLGSQEQALRFYRRALELRPDSDTYRQRLAQYLLFLNNAPEALPHLEQLYSRRPRDPDILVELAECLLATGQPARGRALLDRALTLRPGHVAGLAARGRLALLDGEPARAAALVRRAAAAEPSDRTIHYLYYQCLLRCGKKDEARHQLARLKTLEKDLARLEAILRSDGAANPGNADTFHELGQIFSRHGRPDVRLYWYRHARAVSPNHPASRLALAKHRAETSKAPPRQ